MRRLQEYSQTELWKGDYLNQYYLDKQSQSSTGSKFRQTDQIQGTYIIPTCYVSQGKHRRGACSSLGPCLISSGFSCMVWKWEEKRRNWWRWLRVAVGRTGGMGAQPGTPARLPPPAPRTATPSKLLHTNYSSSHCLDTSISYTNSIPCS